MNNKVYCLYDNKVNAYMLPFYASSDDNAKMSVSIAFSEDSEDFADILRRS